MARRCAGGLVPAGRERQGNRCQARGLGIFVVALPQGDPIHEGAFEAIGIFGQTMCISLKEHL
jgi:hypothetical protein